VAAHANKSIDERILAAAREAFLSMPYERVSLRSVCAKAGVTTGAFYIRYRNKEELFEALVTPALEYIDQLSAERESYSYGLLEQGVPGKVWDTTAQVQRGIMNDLYDRFEPIQLLFFRAAGTKYENYLHQFVEDVTRRSAALVSAVSQRGMSNVLVDEDELHMLMTAYWATMLEPIAHGLSRERALQHSDVVARLFDWQKVLGY